MNAFIKNYLNNDKSSRLYRLFSANLDRIGINADVPLIDGPVIVKQFIADCLKQVVARIQDERLNMLDDKSRVREEWKIPENYRVTLEKDKKGTTLWANILVKQPDQPDGEECWISYKLNELENNEETVNIMSVYYAILVDEDGNQYQSSPGINGGCSVRRVRNGKLYGAVMEYTYDFAVKGICGNRRLMESEIYLRGLKDVCIPVKAIIGATKNLSIISNLTSEILPNTLNEFQKNVVDLTNLKSSQVIIGPPGTGKSKTIVSLIQQMIEELPKDHVIILTSEKNGAVEAVAEHLHRSCCVDGKIENIDLYEKIAAFGSANGMKQKTTFFTFKEKMDHHPHILEAEQNNINAKKSHKAEILKFFVVFKSVKSTFDDTNIERVKDAIVTIDNYRSKKNIEDLKLWDMKAFALLISQMPNLSSENKDIVKKLNDAILLVEAAESRSSETWNLLEETKKEVSSRMRAKTRLMFATIGSMYKIHQCFT